MKNIRLTYIAHITTITGKLFEDYLTKAESIKELIWELESIYPEFKPFFIEEGTQLKLNALIFYFPPGQNPKEVIDISCPIDEGGKITFW